MLRGLLRGLKFGVGVMLKNLGCEMSRLECKRIRKVFLCMPWSWVGNYRLGFTNS